jgi:hypothetical protein
MSTTNELDIITRILGEVMSRMVEEQVSSQQEDNSFKTSEI